jgi:hypothetical protein
LTKGNWPKILKLQFSLQYYRYQEKNYIYDGLSYVSNKNFVKHFSPYIYMDICAYNYLNWFMPWIHYRRMDKWIILFFEVIQPIETKIN